jgi:replicative DNA helicase
MEKGVHYSTDLEMAIIGACLLEKSAMGRIFGLVESKNFYTDDHQLIFSSLLEMYNQNVPIDLITVELFMMGKGIKLYNCNQYGNYAYYLAQTTNAVVSTAHLEYHCWALKELWKLRQLEILTHSGIDATGNVAAQIAELNSQLTEIRGSEFKREWFDMSELLVNLVKHQEDLTSGKKKFLSTGFTAINNANGGFSEGQFIVIGARPSVGKSALMGQMAMHMAKQGKKVGIISLEMHNDEITSRLVALNSDFDYNTIYRNLFQDQEQRQLFYNQISAMENLPIFVSDKTKVDINEIKAKAWKLQNQRGCDCLMVDYLQLVDTITGKNTNREQEVSKISRGLKLLASDLKVPVVALCQLNREIEKRSAKDRYPRLSDLRESGSLEQDADVVMMLHRDWESGYETNDDGSSTEFEADLFGQKWRNGSKFKLKLEWVPSRMMFKPKSNLSNWKQVEITDRTESRKDENPF